MISISSLTVSRDGKKVLSEFSQEIPGKSATLLSGPNGAGKTSLISAIAGTLKPIYGEIAISGKNPYQSTPLDLARCRSVAPQRRIFTLAYTVGEVVNFVPKSLRIGDPERIYSALGLDELWSKKVTELSIGQQQRVSLGLALNQNSDFYLLDEPFDAQDSHFQHEILELISDLKKTKGVLVVSHNTDALHPYFDQEIVLN